MRRKRIAAAIAAVAATAAALIVAVGQGATPVPVPNPLVQVTTRSGSIVKRTPVLIGGVPTPIDVDDVRTAGVPTPDVDVSVALIAVDELPGRPVVPTITIARNPLAIARHAPAPPVRLDASIGIQDAADGLSELARVSYGIETPPDGHLPPVVRAKLLGPIAGGFVDPLEATIESPGYGGPLTFNVDAATPTLNATFSLDFDPLPQRIHFVEDPRSDGLDFAYDHRSAVADVALDADAHLTSLPSRRRLDLRATVERLPDRIAIASTSTPEHLLVDTRTSSPLRKPDIEARYRDTAPDGTISTDAEIKITGVPPHMRGEVRTLPDLGGGRDVDSVDFRVLDGEQIDAVDFLARNWIGDPGPLPEPYLGPRQFVAITSRRTAGGTSRYRAAGRIEGIRSATFERQGAADDEIDVRTDVGSGTRPLRALVDVDNRGPGAPADAKRLALDTTVTPLPRTIHTHMTPARGAEPMRLLYEAGQVVDVDADARVAAGSADGCGQSLVTCATARVDKLPSWLRIDLPAPGRSDYAISHHGGSTGHPDVRAMLDTTPADPARRLHTDLAIARVPNEVRARVDSSPRGVLRRAEFHACDWDYAAEACRDTQDALGRVRFTVRSQAGRGGLPLRPDSTPDFLSLIKRGPVFEATGQLREIRNVAFRQRDEDGDGRADGVLGALLDLGTGAGFDLHVDQETAPEATTVDAHVTALPRHFTACVRQPDDAPPGAAPPQDSVLAPCDRTDVLSRDDAHPLTATPLSIAYTAASRTRVRADVTRTAPKAADGGALHTSEVHTTVADVPSALRADAILPAAGLARRRLEAAYDAEQPIDAVDLELREGRADGRPAAGSVYARTRVERIPRRVAAVMDAGDHVLRQVEFHACPFDFLAGTCPAGSVDPLGAVDFLVRPQRARGALPPRPAHAATYVTLLQRRTQFEITGHVDTIRNAVFRQRDDAPRDDVPDGTLGVSIDAGVGGPFDAHLDTVTEDTRFDDRPETATRLRTHADSLPTHFAACVRQPADPAPHAPAGEDALLAPCERNDILGRSDARPLTTTPLTVAYEAATPTAVSTHLTARGRDADDRGVATDGGREHVTDMKVAIDRVPGRVRGDVILPREAGDGVAARKLEFQYGADAPIDDLALTLDRARTDGTRFVAGGMHAEAHVVDIPATLSGQVDSAGGVTRAVDVHACPFDFLAERCRTPSTDALGSVDVLLRRPGRGRAALPPVPPHEERFVSLVRRFDDEEIRAHVERIRDVVVRQRPGTGGTAPGSTLGVQVNAGTGLGFDAHVDQVVEDTRFPGDPRPGAVTKLDAHVGAQPTAFTACFRQPANTAMQEPSGDAVLAECERRDVLGHDDDRLPAVTPLSFAYAASNPTPVTADLYTRARDPRDGARQRFVQLHSVARDVPSELRADVITPADPADRVAPRPLQLDYRAGAPIQDLDVTLRSARVDGTSAPNGDVYLESRASGIPKALAATVDAPAGKLHHAQFDACRFNWAQRRCDGDAGAIDDLTVLVRKSRARFGLPPVAPHGDEYASVLQRGARQEIRAHLTSIRGFAADQLHAPDGSDGPLGLRVDAGSGNPFDADVDQVAPDEDARLTTPRPDKHLKVHVHVGNLPELITACFRPPVPGAPREPERELSPLIAPCVRTDVLGHDSDHPLTSTPISVAYTASRKTPVTADVMTEAVDLDDGGAEHRREIHVDVPALPSSLRADVVPPQDNGPAPPRRLELAYEASSTATVDATYEDRRTDGMPAPGATFLRARATDLPRVLTGQVELANKLPRAVDLHACHYDFRNHRCRDDLGTLGAATVLLRQQRRRGSLPPVPESLPDNHLSLIKRGTASEIRASIEGMRESVLRIRDRDNDGKPDGTFGAHVEVGTGTAPFMAHIDQVQPDPAHPTDDDVTQVDARVSPLPSRIDACVRLPAETDPFRPADDEAEPVLRECETADLFGHSGTDPLRVTPLSLVYTASEPTRATTDVRMVKRERPADARPTLTKVHGVIDRLSDRVRADVITPVVPRPPSLEHPEPIPGRKLQVAYDAAAPVRGIDLTFERHLDDTLCLDPRPGREALCLRSHVAHLPRHLDVTYDPDESRGDIEFRSTPPAAGQPPLSVSPLHVDLTSADSSTRPISLDVDAIGITPHLRGRVAKADLDGDGRRELAEVKFDACPDGPCGGIERLRFDVTNALVPGVLPPVPLLDRSDGDVQHDVAIVQRATTSSTRGPFFHASGSIGRLKRVSYTQLDDADPPRPTRTKRISAAFGDSPRDRLRAYVDLATRERIPGGTEQRQQTQLVDALIEHAPSAVQVCLREDLPEGEAPSAAPTVPWCARQAAKYLALQARLERAEPGAAPNVDVRRFESTSAGGNQVLIGRFGLDRVGQRVDVLATTRGEPEVRVEGHPVSGDDAADDSTLADVVGRVRFDLRNQRPSRDCNDARDNDGDGLSDLADPQCRSMAAPSESAPASPLAFPYGSLTGAGEPEDDPGNTDGTDGTRNFIAVTKDRSRLQLRGSVPRVKRIALAPRPCVPGDPRFPDPAVPPAPGRPDPLATWRSANVPPKYTCVNAAAAAGRPLGIAVRMLDDDASAVSIDEARISAVPAGGEGLRATLATTPSALRLAPVCARAEDATAAPFCRPPLVALDAPREGERPRLRGRILLGPLDLLDRLGATRPSDPLSQRLDYEQPVAAYPDTDGGGVRLKIGSDEIKTGDDVAKRTAVRLGMNIALPRYLDLDPPTLYSCSRTDGYPGEGDVRSEAPDNSCDAPAGDSRHPNDGTAAKDIGLRIAAAEDHPGAGDAPPLGRGAIFVRDFGSASYVTTGTAQSGTPPSDLIITGARAPDTPVGPRTNPLPGPHAAPPRGGVSVTPEATVPSGPLRPDELGALLPSHLDARVYLRNKYRSPDGDTLRRDFIQIDGRVSSPLSLTMRLNQQMCRQPVRPVAPLFGTVDTVGYCLPTGGDTRSGSPRSGVQLSMRDAPAGNVNASAPTFRIRAEIRKPHVRVRPLDFGDAAHCQDMGGDQAGAEGFNIVILHMCAILPKPDVRWLDLNLHADPDGPGGQPPARDLEAVVDTKDTDIDLEAYREPLRSTDAKGPERVGGVDQPLAPSPTADFTPQAALRLSPFQIGFDVGSDLLIAGSSVKYLLDGDLIAKAAGYDARRLRLSSRAGAIHLGASRGGVAHVETDLSGRVRVRVNVRLLFGLIDIPIEAADPPDGLPAAHFPVAFKECTLVGGQRPYLAPYHPLNPDFLNVDGRERPSDERNAIEIAPQLNLTGASASALTAISAFLSPFMCLTDTGVAPKIVAGAPAPPFGEPGRDVPDSPPSTVGTTTTTGNGDSRPNLVIGPSEAAGADVTECGTLRVDRLVVRRGGTLRVGAQGTTITRTIDGTPRTLTCHGQLNIDATRVEVESGGVITGSATRNDGSGTPASAGGGAGHGGPGGAGGLGGSGGRTYPAMAPSSLASDFGSAGAGGSGVAGGRGGGAVSISATGSVDIGGVVAATGAPGRDSAANCADVAGGGGSGGAIQINANRVTLQPGGVRLDARGGDGGSGGAGGGGGGGGRVLVNAIISSLPGGSRTAERGHAGGSGCPAGRDGGDGPADLGRQLGFAAFVERAPDKPLWTQRAPTLHIRGLKQGGGRFHIVICRVRATTGATLDGAPVDPPAVPGTGDLVRGEDCVDHDFRGPTSGSDVYEADVRAPTLDAGNGYYGWYAFGAVGDGVDDCVRGPLIGGCTWQQLPPRKAQVRTGIDRTPPTISAVSTDGLDGCPSGSKCLSRPTGQLHFDANDAAPGSGIRDAQCSLDGGPFNVPCTTTGDGFVQVPLHGGLNTVRVRVLDNAASTDTPPAPGDVTYNARELTAPILWYVDTQPPRVNFELVPHGTRVDGFYDQQPTIFISGFDESGFQNDAYELRIDGAAVRCPRNPALSGNCVLEPGNPVIPRSGIHTFTVVGRDRVGRETVTQTETMRVDRDAPRSGLVLGPADPDGDGGWYRTRPTLAFAADDDAGTGVNLETATGTSGIFLTIDGASDRYAEGRTSQLAEGRHEVCWAAVDRLGNRESPGQCRTLRVDSRAPAVDLALAPSAPDGRDGWYRTNPELRIRASDGSGDVSGVARVRWSLDGEPFVSFDPSSPPVVPQGVHEVCVSATDNAGNVGDPACRDVRVDTTAPPDPQVSTDPPRPDGANGWFRTPVSVDLAAADAGSGLDAILLRIDGGAEHVYDPEDRGGNTLGDGEHRVCWRLRDVAGNVNDGTARCDRVNVDTSAPRVALDLDPTAPDGANGWYRSEPRLTFSGLSDGGGSGVDRTTTPSGLFVSVDGGRPRSVATAEVVRVPEGDHEVCAFVVDVAGNAGSAEGEDIPSCRRVRVDTTAPGDAEVDLDPAAPDGRNGWYVTRPSFVVAGIDAPEGSGVDVTAATPPSGLFVELDGAAPRRFDDHVVELLSDGVHELCAFTRDIAGNRGPRGCQTVKADTTAPLAFDPITPALPDGANSFYLVTPRVAPGASDAAGGSGVATSEVQVDNGLWAAAPANVAEGDHVVRVRARDVAGNLSPMLERVVRVDRSDPSGAIGSYPSRPNTQDWFRQPVVEAVAVEDGRDSSGADGASVSVDGAAAFSYLKPVTVGEGDHTLRATPRDRAGRRGDPVELRSRVDLHGPDPQPVEGSLLESTLLPGQTVPMRFTVADALASRVLVTVEVLNTLGGVVREIAAPGSYAGGYRDTGPGSVTWNGRDHAGRRVPPGLYYYRVAAIDLAGNAASSTESTQIVVVQPPSLSGSP